MKTVDLSIQGMSCGHCVMAVRQALEHVEGVARAEVEVGRAKVEAHEQVSREALLAAIAEAGYAAA